MPCWACMSRTCTHIVMTAVCRCTCFSFANAQFSAHAVHCWADYQAAVDMRARSASSLRHQLAGSGRSSRRQRRYSAGYTPSTPKTEDSMQRAATLFEPLGVDLRRRLSIGGIAESFGSTILSSMSRNLDTLLSPGSSASLDQAPEVRSGSGAQKGRATRINHQGVQAEEHDEHNVGKTGDQRYALLLSIDLLMATPPLTVITLSWLHTAV